MSRTKGPGVVAGVFYQTEESRRRRVQNLYRDLLGRGTDPGGETFWSNLLITQDDLVLAVYLVSSDEFYASA